VGYKKFLLKIKTIFEKKFHALQNQITNA